MVQKIQIEDKYITQMKQIMAPFLPSSGAKVYVFGSRAQNTALPYSDVDIAIDCGGRMEGASYTGLCFAFSASSFPYKTDIVDVHNISPEFYGQIRDTMIRIV